MATTPDGTPFVEPGDAISAYPVVSQELAAVIDSLRTMIPAGAIFPYAGKLAPEGYLLCDGKAYNRSDFFDLYNVMTEWAGQWGGFPNGDTSLFYVPDFRGRSPIGVATSAQLPDSGTTPAAPIELGVRKGDWRMYRHFHWIGSISTVGGSNVAVRNDATGGEWGSSWEGSGTDHNFHPVTGVNFIVWTGTTTTGKNPVPGVELGPVTTRMMLEARLEQAGIGEEEIEMLRDHLATLKEDTDG